jgi:signal transduction histidine kinase
VFILHSFGSEVDFFAEAAASFRAELTHVAPYPIEFFEAAVETARFSEVENEAPLVGYLDALFAEHTIDLFVAVGGPAATFALRQHDRFLSSTPLVVTGVEQRVIDQVPGGRYAAATTVHLDLPGSIDNLLRLLPDTQQVVVVLGDSPLSKFWLQQTQQAFAPYADRVHFTWTSSWPLDELLARAAELPPGSVVYFGELWVDANGVPYTAHTALERLHGVATVPIFGLFESQLGRGIVGGPLVSEAEVGRLTADAALRVLEGGARAPVETATVVAGAPEYDARELERWGISADRLPPTSTVLFRPVSTWQRNRLTIVSVAGIIALQAVLIAGLLVQRRRRRGAEEEARGFAQRLLTAHEDERRILARELHDDLSQRLARIAIDTARVQRTLADTPDEELARSIREGLAELSEDVHTLSYQLHPRVLDDLGLEQALAVECNRFSRREKTMADLTVFEAPADLPDAVEICLFRVAQEALSNVARHALARNVSITVAALDNVVRLQVSDDGVGFDPAGRSISRGLGHTSMRERARLVGGHLDIRGIPGRGTTVTLSVALPGAKS